MTQKSATRKLVLVLIILIMLAAGAFGAYQLMERSVESKEPWQEVIIKGGKKFTVTHFTPVPKE